MATDSDILESLGGRGRNVEWPQEGTEAPRDSFNLFCLTDREQPWQEGFLVTRSFFFIYSVSTAYFLNKVPCRLFAWIVGFIEQVLTQLVWQNKKISVFFGL